MTQKLLRLLGSALLLASAAQATEIINDTSSPGLGMNVLPAGENRWLSPLMTCPAAPTRTVWTGEDFFVGEYGSPCVFTEDWVKKYGFHGNGDYEVKNGAMTFTTGAKGFYFGFGAEAGDHVRDSIRFGLPWGKNKKDNYRLSMELSQDSGATEWEFTTNSFFQSGLTPKSFTVKGKGGQTVETDLGIVRVLDGTSGIRLACKTPGATVSIKSLKIAPYSKEVFFRKQFHLDAKPVVAPATFEAPETYELRINGQQIDAGSNIYPCGNVKTIDLAPYLAKGENLIEFRKEFFRWSGGSPDWLFEAAAIDRDGNIIRLLGDQSWRCSLDAANWTAPKLSPAAPGLNVTSLANGKAAATGVDPAHMGMIQTSPADRQYPLFDFNEDIRFNLKMPAGVVGNLTPSLSVREAGTGMPVETVNAGAPTGERGGLEQYAFPLKTRKPGPYKLEWTLRDNSGKLVETRLDELVVAGPIAQDSFGLGTFEEEFEKRLKLVKHIDCTTIPNSASFLDHAGMYSPAATNKGKVITSDGFRYRETGTSRWDYFAYLIELEKRGEPHVVEIVIPDNRDRCVYSGVVEKYPVAFSNNYPDGSRGRFKCTGTALTGIAKPLSFTERRLRYLYWPGNSAAAVVVMSGMQDYPAAASAINIYAIDGGLPALKSPETDRMFGSHNERLSTLLESLGAAESPLTLDNRFILNGLRDGWFMWYKAVERKIQLLRHRGMNMTVEGAYMYSQAQYPSPRHSPCVSNQELDGLRLALKMYKHNNIKCMLGFEYVVSPAVAISGVDKLSDRKVRQGAGGVQHVDRHGRQMGSSLGGGGNFLQPDSEKMMLDTLAELYGRYNSAGEVAGLFWVVGEWWAPGFIRGTFRDIENTEVGYDDLTVELFEQEAGLKLGITPSDPRRFQKRYDKLMADDLRPLWLHWRALKVRQFFDKARNIVGQGGDKWPIHIFPTGGFEKENPFDALEGTRAERDGYAAKRLADAGLIPELYPGGDGVNLVPALNTYSKYDSPSAPYLRIYGWNKSPSTLALINRAKAAYWCVANGLDEIDCPASGSSKWLWSHTTRGVFVPRWIGDNCMADFVDVMASTIIPKIVFDSWLDCNLETGHGDQLRRFAADFYATPELEFKPLSAKGVTAQTATAGDVTYLRLVNDSPYPLTGFVRADAKSARDLVRDQELAAEPLSEKYHLDLRPYDMRTISLRGLKGKVGCAFSLPDATTKEIAAKASFLLKDEACLKKIPGDLVAALAAKLQEGDAFALYRIMDNYEVAASIINTAKNYRALKNQTAFLYDLEQTGKARIICASERPYTDLRKKVWHPDQAYSGCGAYGNQGASFADRGEIPIQDTDLDRVYQTEAYGGHVFYHIPVPDGRYNIHLLFAETYAPINKPGIRLFTVKAEHLLHPEKIDPFALAGGFCRPYTLTFKDLPVNDGVIDIEMRGGVGIAGIEVEKAKE